MLGIGEDDPGRALGACPAARRTSSSTRSSTSPGGPRSTTTTFKARVTEATEADPLGGGRQLLDRAGHRVGPGRHRRLVRPAVRHGDGPHHPAHGPAHRHPPGALERQQGAAGPICGPFNPEKSIIAWAATRHGVYRRRYGAAEHDPRWAGLQLRPPALAGARRTPSSPGVTSQRRRRSDEWISNWPARPCSSPGAPTGSGWPWPSSWPPRAQRWRSAAGTRSGCAPPRPRCRRRAATCWRSGPTSHEAGDLEAFVEAAVARWGRIDGVVHNAGRASAGPIESIDDATWESDFQLKLMAAVRLTRLALPQLRASQGLDPVHPGPGGQGPGGGERAELGHPRRRHGAHEGALEGARARRHPGQRRAHRPHRERAVGAPGRGRRATGSSSSTTASPRTRRIPLGSLRPRRRVRRPRAASCCRPARRT